MVKPRIFLTAAILVLAMAATAAAADAAGKWIAEQEGRQGSQQTTFNFSVKGTTLTGTVSGGQGESAIRDGKIEGDNISFAVVRTMGEMEMKTLYKGKISGDEIRFTVERQRGAGGPGGGRGPGGPGGGMGPGGPGVPGGMGPGGQRAPQELVVKRVK